MTTLIVTYPGDAGTPFDRAYYVERHLPLVMEAWRPDGLESTAAFFPSGDGAGIIALCICQFKNAASLTKALASPQTVRVMADVPRFTDAQPTQSHAVPL